uniref:BTB domain-containing protein n=2 Tax=Panagrolaimus sp. ES5 TaxID=591445 RepID=A0AC34GPB5_9BILA
MALQQQQKSLSEFKVPFYCEWIFELHGWGGHQHLKSPKYSLPGFPGIKYFFDAKAGEEKDDDMETDDVGNDIVNDDADIVSNADSDNFFNSDDDDSVVYENAFLDFNVQIDYKVYKVKVDYKYKLNYDGNDMDDEFDHRRPHELYKGLYSRSLCGCEWNSQCGVLRDQKNVVRVKGTFTVQVADALPIAVQVPAENLTMFYMNADKDFVFAVEEQEIRVHKSILIENSPVFATMLDSDKWKETMENRIVVSDVSFKVVEIAINAYYGKVYEKPLTKEEYLMLFQFADKYDMEKLKKAVEQSIVFHPNNVVEYANFFLQGYCDDLVNCAIDYILSCSQYSVPIQDIDVLDNQIRGMFFDRTIVNPVFKKDLKENVSVQ